MGSYIQSPHLKPSICELINLIYQAALQPQLWQRILNDIRILCDADQCTLFFYDALEPGRCLASAARADEKILTQYLNNFIAQQAMQINTQFKSLPEGIVVTDDDVNRYVGDEYSGIVGTDYMQTFWPNLKFEAGVVLLRGASSCAGLGLQNFTGSPALTQENISLLQDLSPHLRQAMHLHQKLTQIGHTNDGLKTVLNASKIGIILLDEKLTLQFINHRAKQFLGKIDQTNFYNTQQLIIEKINKDQIHKIVAHFNRLNQDDSTSRQSKAELKLDYKNGHLKVSGYALQRELPATHTKSLSATDTSGAGYLLLIQDSNPGCHLNSQYLHSAYEITAAEQKLILSMINGASLLDSADVQIVKPSTARWHLKNIMQKTLTHSQTELTRLMLELCD